MTGFFNSIESAYNSSLNIEDKNKIKQALKYYNFLLSDGGTKELIQKPEIYSLIDRIPPDNEGRIDQDLKNIIQEKNGYRRKEGKAQVSRLYSVKKLNGRRSETLQSFGDALIRESPWTREESSLNQEILDLVGEEWRKEGEGNRTIWLFFSEDVEHPGKENPIEFLYRLGLYSWEKMEKEEKILIVQFQVPSVCYKPTWLDADFQFYFDPFPDSDDFGCTKCLLSGKSGLKEWVSEKKDLILEDTWAFVLPKNICLDSPSDEFWRKQCETLLKSRNGRNH